MATPQLRPINHEDVFAERYYSLLKWASQLAGGNAALAQDLVHDGYVQFVLARPDLGKIQNLDRYLYGMLRNLHISYIRRALIVGSFDGFEARREKPRKDHPGPRFGSFSIVGCQFRLCHIDRSRPFGGIEWPVSSK